MFAEQVGDGTDNVRFVSFNRRPAKVLGNRGFLASPKIHEEARIRRNVLDTRYYIAFSQHEGPRTRPGRVFQGVPSLSLSNIRPNCKAVSYSSATNLSVYEANSLHSRIASSLKVGNEYIFADTDERCDVSCNSANCIGLRLRPSSNAPYLSRRNPGHANGVLRRLRGDGHRVFGVPCNCFFAKQKPMPNLLQNLFKFLPPLLLSLPYDLRGLNTLSGDVNPVANDSNFTVTHAKTLGNIRYVKKLFSANTVFKTT